MKFNKIENQPKYKSGTIAPPLILISWAALSKEMLDKNKMVCKKNFDQNIDIKKYQYVVSDIKDIIRYQRYLLICTWFLKKSIWINQVRQTGFIVHFKLDFYNLCSMQESISKLIFSS